MLILPHEQVLRHETGSAEEGAGYALKLPPRPYFFIVRAPKREFFIDNLPFLIVEMILVDRPCAMGV